MKTLFDVTDRAAIEARLQALQTLLEKFCQAGPNAAGQHEHVFFGKLTGDQWGVLMHKHIDHHLRQFGA